MRFTSGADAVGVAVGGSDVVARWANRSLLQHDMAVGAAHAEGADTGPAQVTRGRPRPRRRDDLERTAVEVDGGVRTLEVEARREHTARMFRHERSNTMRPMTPAASSR